MDFQERKYTLAAYNIVISFMQTDVDVKVRKLTLDLVTCHIIVSDGGASECLDPEGKGVNPGKWAGGGGLAHLVRSKISS